jgi:hypothetical protein
MGGQTGLTWQDAMDLQTAVNTANSGDELWLLGENNIWNAGGRYQLTAALSINIPNVGIYGGFRGTEASLAQRNALIACNNPAFPNYFVYPSILMRNSTATGNFSIVSFMNAYDCVLDGLIIEQGLNTAQGVMPSGGGLSAQNSGHIVVENVVFRQNRGWNGGGIYLENVHGDTLIKNCVIENNIADNGEGGGVYMLNCGDTAFVNVLLFGNNMQLSGAYVRGGGAIGIANSHQIRFFNVTVADNYITNLPAGITNPGLGVYCDNSDIEFYNSIFYPDDIAANTASNLLFDSCLLNQTQASLPMANMRNCIFPPNNPRFVNASVTGWNYHLWTSPPFAVQSPCIDAGNNFAFPPGLFPPVIDDLEGKPRFMGATTPPIIDMGAFEHNT